MMFSPFNVKTEQTLSDVQKRLQPKDETNRSELYWSAVREEPNRLGRPGSMAPLQVQPNVLEATDEFPERLFVRCYSWSLNKTALMLTGEFEDKWYQLEALDILMYQSDEGLVSGVVSTRSSSSLSRDAKPILETLFSIHGKSPTINLGPQANDLITEDFFLWLLFRNNTDKHISDNLYLAQVSEINGSDKQSRSSRIGDSATMDRAELLALLIGGTTKFGPAKISIEDSETSLFATLKIHQDSGFEISTTYSKFKGDKHRQIPPGASYRLQMFQDIYFTILPNLIHSYNIDEDWRSNGKERFIKSAQDLLAKVLNEVLRRNESA